MNTSTLSLLGSLISCSLCAQNLCTEDGALSENTSFEISFYGSSNNLVEVSHFNVTATFNTADGRKAIIAQTNRDTTTTEKEKYYAIECNDAALLINNKNIIPAYVFEEFHNMDLDATSSSLSIPKELHVGQKLSNADYKIEIEVTPIKHRLHYFLTDRIVTSKETINTPAGTFECYLIESKTHMRPQNKNTGSVKQWFAEDIGLIKQVDYNLEGAITGINLLTDLKF